MKTRTAQWDAAVVQSHQIAVKATVMYNRRVITAPLALVSGTVTLDRTAAQLGRFEGTFAEPTLIPSPDSPLSPYGYELVIERGIRYTDSQVELMPLGVFPIQLASTNGLTLNTDVTAVDRSQLVKDARLEDDYPIAAGVNYATAIQAFIGAGVPGLVYVFEAVPFVTPLLTFSAQEDRWDRAREMAKACGCELFFDGVGQLVMRKEPVLTGVSVFSVAEGANGVLINAGLLLDRGPTYNRVIASGSNSSLGTVPIGVWTDVLAGSPSNYIGGFGRKPKFYTSEFITTEAQAIAAATAIGVAQQGVARALDLSMVPNPALEPGDVITVKRQALGIDETHLLDSVVINLTAEQPMSAASRTQISSPVTVGVNKNVSAGVATGSGVANDPGTGRTPTTATATGTANDATVVIT